MSSDDLNRIMEDLAMNLNSMDEKDATTALLDELPEQSKPTPAGFTAADPMYYTVMNKRVREICDEAIAEAAPAIIQRFLDTPITDQSIANAIWDEAV